MKHQEVEFVAGAIKLNSVPEFHRDFVAPVEFGVSGKGAFDIEERFALFD